MVVITVENVGRWNFGACHRGTGSCKTPRLDERTSEGKMFIESYAKASCIAGPVPLAVFIRIPNSSKG